MGKYIIGIDQSTQGTKALLVGENGKILCRTDKPHRQIIDKNGWVEHDPLEILHNTADVVRMLIVKSGVSESDIAGIGISNQRETGVVWNRKTGEPLCNAIVWQCARARDICERIADTGAEPMIKERTGINLSPYFTAGKIAWVIENIPGAKELNESGTLGCGTVDSWLLFRLTDGKCYATDYSNASRTQLFNINTLRWDDEICRLFGIDVRNMPEVRFSDSDFGETDMLGVFGHKVPLHAVMGDSHAALYGQGCHESGMVKSTYGTGSSVMMNVGVSPVHSEALVSSLAWGIGGRVSYVLEGNINYSAAVITWLKDDLGLISSAAETAELARNANPEDTAVLVPAFSGLGAPYWRSDAKAAIVGMTRSTGRNEIVRAALESIALQNSDVLAAMEKDSGIKVAQLRVDGGPTANEYLMQFQSDMAGCEIIVPEAEELSGLGAALLAGISIGVFSEDAVFSGRITRSYTPLCSKRERREKLGRWHDALDSVL